MPLNNSELIWFTDKSSFIKDGQKKAGAAIVDDSRKIIWAEALPLRTSAQKAELIALIQALERAKKKKKSHYLYQQSVCIQHRTHPGPNI